MQVTTLSSTAATKVELTKEISKLLRQLDSVISSQNNSKALE
jgi:hypothetical protein